MAKKDFMAAFLREREQSEAVSNLDTVNVTPLAINMIGENADNFYNVDDIDDLVESIREHGLLHPIVTNNGTTVISGHRRLAAYRRLWAETGNEEYKMIPCIVLHPADPIESEMMMIEANSTARVLTPYELMEQAKRYDALLVKAKDHGYEYEGRRRDIVAKMMKVGPAKVGRYAAIDKHLNESWKFLFQQGEISESVAYEISKMDMDAQESVLDVFLDDDGHVNVTLAEVQRFAADMQKVNEEPDIEPELKELPEQGYTLCTPDGEPEIVGLPPRNPEPEKPVRHDIAPDPDPETEHEETLDKWRKMAEDQEAQGDESISERMENRVMALRESLGLSKAKMAEKLGWFQAAYSAVESSGSPASWRLYEIAVCFDVSMDWLVGLSDTKKPAINISKGRERLTHKRCNGIKSGYWSPAKKDDLIDRLAEYENAEEKTRK